MGQSRKLTLTDWTVANNLLMQRFEGNKSELAKHVKMSRTTVTNFLNQKPVGENSFRKICLSLGLNWQKYSAIDSATISSEKETDTHDTVSPESIRERCRQKILAQHSRIRLLSGEVIKVDQLYVDVWLLGKPERKHFNTLESLLDNFDIASDRLALGKRIQRNPGFEIANSSPKLVILGKPGSGKTTFLKHLAVDWCRGAFQSEKIAVLIELRRIQEQQNEWQLIKAICHELKLKEKDALGFLEQGKLLILMDGLDEVPTEQLRRNVQSQVRRVSEKYSRQNRFIMTCRTQIMSAIPSGFTSVEVADFSSHQVRQFVQNWFTANGQSEIEAIQQWEKIQRSTKNQPDLRELTVTPVLLSLICVVLQDSGEIPSDRTDLYRRGINWLLNRWNDAKEIEGWEVGTKAYHQVSTKDKRALLTEIAARKFEDPKNFVLFAQDELVNQISQKLKLNDEKEGISVLKAIESQHGLLIERADELWSFSHLTFQEYFTVQWLTQLPHGELAEKIVNQKWQIAVEQLVKSQQPADRLVRLIKQAIDQMISRLPIIQNFLCWLSQKSSVYQASYNTAAIRAFYYSLSCEHTIDFAHNCPLDLVLSRAIDLDFILDLNLSFGFGADVNLALDHAIDCAKTSDRLFALDAVLMLALVRARAHAFALGCTREVDMNVRFSSDLMSCLSQLREELPSQNHSKTTQRWWLSYGNKWIEQLRRLMLEHRNIGHDWQFNKDHNKQLKRYYSVNKFLINLMKIKGAVSEECRVDIEEGLLLPWAELQCLQPHLYGELNQL